MNGPIWLVWLVIIFMFVLSIILLNGKGSFMIAGYNTSSAEEKKKYNEIRLCRVVGSGLLILTMILAAVILFNLPTVIEQLLIPWGMLATAAAILVLSNTVCKV